MMIDCNIFLEEIATWGVDEITAIKKKLNIKKSTKRIQLLQIHKLFMPWHLHKLLKRCGYDEMVGILNKETNNCDEPIHGSYCLHNDNLVKKACESTQ